MLTFYYLILSNFIAFILLIMIKVALNSINIPMAPFINRPINKPIKIKNPDHPFFKSLEDLRIMRKFDISFDHLKTQYRL